LNCPIKRIIKHYPEFTPKKRWSKPEAKEALSVAPLYQVLPSGEIVEIPIPVKREKPLSNKELFEIKKWSWESSKNYLSCYDAYTDIDDSEDEDELEAVEEAIEKAIEKEHQDYLLLKAEESEQKKKGKL
jgi:hypothetical protein